MLDFKKAVEKLSNSLNMQDIGYEKIPISEAEGRVLYSDVVAYFDSPQYPTSAMDGYAIRFGDQKFGKIKVLDSLPAGSDKKLTVNKGEAVKTFTGSLMSEGADTLIPIENVQVEDNYIVIQQKVEKGFSIREVGENFKKGEILIPKGSIISPAEIGVLASLNIPIVSVFQKPRLSIVSTGSEILDLGEPSESIAKIRSSNNYFLEALGKKSGAIVSQIGIVKDEKDEIEKTIFNELKRNDIVVTTGGVSVGDYDFVGKIIKNIGGELLFEKVNIKPGQHIKALKIGEKYLFALPGFPYSSFVTFSIFVVLIIKQLGGMSSELQRVKATLKEDYKKKGGKKREFAVCNLYFNGKSFSVDFENVKTGTSAILTNLIGKNRALIEISEKVTELKSGQKVDVILLNNFLS